MTVPDAGGSGVFVFLGGLETPRSKPYGEDFGEARLGLWKH